MADSSIRMSSFAFTAQSPYKVRRLARRNESSSLSELESVLIQDTHFISPSEIGSKLRLLNGPGVNIRSSATRGMASTVRHVDVVLQPPIPSQVVIARG